MSSPAKSAVAASSTVISPSFHGSVAPGRPGRGEQPQLGHRERPLGEDPAHDAADLTGCSDDPYSHGRKATDGAAGLPKRVRPRGPMSSPGVGAETTERRRRRLTIRL